jgi:nitroimidazol reductase NimA-like FMN-containing flavoprotein (pyridoxamine 5'-phosphate oxidase superfamily)
MTAEIETRTGLEILDHDQCVALLERSSLARIAVVIGAQPLVFPVNFTLDGDAVVFRTDEGTKLYAARNGPVAFECDGVDSLYHTGWSVLGTGEAEEVVNEAELARLAARFHTVRVPGPEVHVVAHPTANAHRAANPAQTPDAAELQPRRLATRRPDRHSRGRFRPPPG